MAGSNKSSSPGAGDFVDTVIADWARQRPDLDTSPVAIVARIGRLRNFFDAGLERVFRQFEVTRAGFDVLATLKRSGAPYRLPQNVLMRALMRTSGTTSFRIDQLERAGLVRREADPEDGRGALVTLTRKGMGVFDAVVPKHLANERELVAALTGAERQMLATLLRKLLLSFEG